MERITSQKKIILDYLKSVKTHPSAEEVYSAVRKKLPHISRGTVYRILKKFKEKGIVQEVYSFVSHFDGDTSSHGHFICKECGKIYDVFNKKCEVNIKRTENGKVHDCQVYLYGICKKCQINN